MKPFLNGLSIFLGILLLGLMSCSTATDYTSSSPTKDKIPPTVTISTNKSLEMGKTGTITFIFSEKVINFTPNDIELLINGVNAAKGNFVTNNQKSYSLEITPKTDGTLYVSIQANSFEDLSGNQNTDSFSNNFLVKEDKTPPTLTISTNKSLEIDKTATITFTFSEEVNGFTKNDVKFSSDDFSVNSVNDITITNFITNNPKEYSLDITPKVTGTLTISVPANSFEDLSSNKNTNSFSNNFLVKEDKTPPTLTISTNKSLEIDKTATITFTFSEEVNGFTKNDVKFSSDDFSVNSVNDITITNFITNNPKEYSLDITPKVTGTLTISVPANSFEDLSSNKNTNSFSTNFSVEDNIPPTVIINSDTLIEGTSAYLSFIFSEKVNNFTPDDIQFLPNEANGVNAEKGNFVTNSQKSYSLEITPETNGSLYVSIPANSFEDLSGNKNDKPYSNSFTVLDSTTTTHTISFNLNGGSFISSQITNLRVVSNTAIEENRLGGILSYPPTGPKPSIQAVTRDIFEWRNTNGTKYDFSTPVSSDLTLEAVWSNSCGKIETFHPSNRDELKNYVDTAVANSTTNLNHIDTSAITDMNRLFASKNSFNGKIGCWNTANATDMSEMFTDAQTFNQDISSWDVSMVADMIYMFSYAYKFNQDIGSWNVANATDMSEMFAYTQTFNQDISSWDVSSVNNMYNMFHYASSFDQNLSSWNVANVTSYDGVFHASPMAIETNKHPSFPSP